MPELSGIPGVKARSISAAVVHSVDEALGVLMAAQGKRNIRAITAAGDTGAINAWRDDAGNFCAHFMCRMVTQSETTQRVAAELRPWLEAWWPQMNAQDIHTVSVQRVEELLAIPCCHVTGMHDPVHVGKYVCLYQKANAYDRIVATLKLRPAGLIDLKTYVSQEGCYWCRDRKVED